MPQGLVAPSHSASIAAGGALRMRRAAPALLARAAPARAHGAAFTRSAGSSSAADGISPHIKLLLNARQLLEDLAPAEVLPVAGVSFEGRQELLGRLELRQPVLAVPEPDNPHDPNAVRLETPAGETMGYVPRTMTGLFRRAEASPGHVESVGPAADGQLLGARVRLWPTLPAVTLDPLPPSWGAAADLAKALGPDRWAALSSAAVARAGGRCQVTGVPATRLPLETVPVFSYSPAARRVAVAELMAVSAPIARAKALDRIGGAQGRAAALALVVGLNSWGPRDLERYLERVHRRRQQLESEGWTLDLERLTAAATANAAAAGAAQTPSAEPQPLA